MYDENGAIVCEVVLKDRMHMASEGMFIVVLTVQRGSGRLLTSPDIISRGFIYLRDSEELMGLIRQYLKQKVARTFSDKHADLDAIKKELKEEITHILYDQTRRTPIVIPVINEIGGGNTGDQAQPNKQNRTPDILKSPVQFVPNKFPPVQVPDSEANEPRARLDHRSY